MKRFMAAIGCVSIILTCGGSYAAPGDLDPSFGTGGGGVATVFLLEGQPPFTSCCIELFGDLIAVGSDGKIVVAGEGGADNERDANWLAVARFNPDGTVDNTFGIDGVRLLAFDTVTHPIGLAITPEGAVVVAGSTHPGFPGNFIAEPISIAVARFTATGDPDPAFGNQGKVVVPLHEDQFTGFVSGMALQGENVLVASSIQIVEGYSSGLITAPILQSVFQLTRLRSNGVPDALFGGTGTITTAFGRGGAIPLSVAVGPDGKIVAAGCSFRTSSDPDLFAVARYSADGALDNTFGHGGTITTFLSGLGTGGDCVNAMAVQADSKIVVGGTYKLVRYNADGTLDLFFGNGGIVTPGFLITIGDPDPIRSITMQPDGKILVGTKQRLVRYTANGDLDTSFAGSGVAHLPGIGFDSESSLAIQMKSILQGEVVVPGSLTAPLPSPCQVGCIAAARFDAFTNRLFVPGSFTLAPAESIQPVDEPFLYSFAWTVPNGRSWRTLQTLQLRIRDGAAVVIDVIFDVASNTFSLRDEATGWPGPAAAPGSSRTLATRRALLRMSDTEVVAAGPTASTVTLNLSLDLKPLTIRRSLAVEVSALDDRGNATGFVPAGTLMILEH